MLQRVSSTSRIRVSNETLTASWRDTILSVSIQFACGIRDSSYICIWNFNVRNYEHFVPTNSRSSSSTSSSFLSRQILHLWILIFCGLCVLSKTSFIFVRLSNKATKIDFYFSYFHLWFCHHRVDDNDNTATRCEAKRNLTWTHHTIYTYIYIYGQIA